MLYRVYFCCHQNLTGFHFMKFFFFPQRFLIHCFTIRSLKSNFSFYLWFPSLCKPSLIPNHSWCLFLVLLKSISHAKYIVTGKYRSEMQIFQCIKRIERTFIFWNNWKSCWKLHKLIFLLKIRKKSTNFENTILFIWKHILLYYFLKKIFFIVFSHFLCNIIKKVQFFLIQYYFFNTIFNTISCVSFL